MIKNLFRKRHVGIISTNCDYCNSMPLELKTVRKMLHDQRNTPAVICILLSDALYLLITDGRIVGAELICRRKKRCFCAAEAPLPPSFCSLRTRIMKLFVAPKIVRL